MFICKSFGNYWGLWVELKVLLQRFLLDIFVLMKYSFICTFIFNLGQGCPKLVLKSRYPTCFNSLPGGSYSLLSKSIFSRAIIWFKCVESRKELKYAGILGPWGLFNFGFIFYLQVFYRIEYSKGIELNSSRASIVQLLNGFLCQSQIILLSGLRRTWLHWGGIRSIGFRLVGHI